MNENCDETSDEEINNRSLGFVLFCFVLFIFVLLVMGWWCLQAVSKLHYPGNYHDNNHYCNITKMPKRGNLNICLLL